MENIVIGNGIVGQFLALKLYSLGKQVTLVGKGVPFERFLLIHECGFRALESIVEQIPVFHLNGIKAFWEGNIRWTLPFDQWRLRLGTITYHHLWKILQEELQTRNIPIIESHVIRLYEQTGTIVLENNQVIKGNNISLTVPLNEFTNRHKPTLTYRHSKPLYMGWTEMPAHHHWAYQWQSKLGYSLLIPMREKYVFVTTDPENANELSQICEIPLPNSWIKLPLQSHWYLKRQYGKVTLVGDAARRMHPHTGLGLNDTLRQISKKQISFTHKLKDFSLFIGGIFLENCWGRRKWCLPITYKMFSMKLIRNWFWA